MELLGHHQAQQSDDLFYTALQYVRINGHHLPHFVSPSPGVFQWVAKDLLDTQGGVASRSERGRTVHNHFWLAVDHLLPLMIGPGALGDLDADSDED